LRVDPSLVLSELGHSKSQEIYTLSDLNVYQCLERQFIIIIRVLVLFPVPSDVMSLSPGHPCAGSSVAGQPLPVLVTAASPGGWSSSHYQLLRVLGSI
jgi:hypothetical protein